MELYMQNREHKRIILESVKHGLLIWPTIEENGVTRTKKYVELSAAKKIHADCDLKATNIILKGLPNDIYSLVNHHIAAKDLWERVQLLLYCKLPDVLRPYASFMGFMVYQMDVKSAFLYGTIEEEVYVCQPLGFEDPDYPDKVYKVVKALYGLHQAPRAWQKVDILLVQIYVDDIIFGSTNKDLCKSFKKLMKDKFQMSSMGLIDEKSASTPIDTEKPLLKDPDGEDVDVHIYISMIGSLMYLTSSRPNIMFAISACACFQVTPKALHLHAVKRIFRYLKGKPHLGLWYPKDSPFDLVAYLDSDYAGASLDRKSINEGCQFLKCRLISWQCKKQTVVVTSSTEAEYVVAAGCCQQRVVKCFNCQGEGHMARQCPKPKRKRDPTWFRDRVLLVEAQGSDKVLNEEELELLVDPGVAKDPVTQMVITHNAAYQADDLDAYDSDCDDFSTAKEVFMANLSSYESDVLFE
nr:hypothetical protein [Tanacetum cinerariifolium]